MESWEEKLSKWFNSYCNSFKGLTDEQRRDFDIKRDHSIRVANFSVQLADKLGFSVEEQKLAYFVGLFHDVGRFRQLKEFNTFNDAKSVDHAKYSVEVLNENGLFEKFEMEDVGLIITAIQNHNKLQLPGKLTENELKFAKLIRDADKIDILKVLTEYYSTRNGVANHTLTWELPKGSSVSKTVAKEILDEKLVSKKNVLSEIDVKIMQMSWVYDLNYRFSFEHLLKNRFLETIYNTLPKNDLVIEIYRNVKVYSENIIYNR
ncbi:MAG: HD domain-containing protein [Draconibacterium sp.]|nr:HD domain-containing protein [Draconibacterium sp.]